MKIEVAPSFTYTVFKQIHPELMKASLEGLTLFSASHWKEKMKKKLCAHIFHMKGFSPNVKRSEKIDGMETKSLDLTRLEGMDGVVWLHQKCARYLQQLSQIEIDEISSEEKELLFSAVQFSASDYSHTNAEVKARILEKKPTMISFGYWTHAVKLGFWGDLVFISDRKGDRPSVEVFHFNRDKLTEEGIAMIRSCYSQSSARYEKVREQLKSELDLTQGEFETELQKYAVSKVKNQEVGNCAFASLEGMEWVLLVLHKVPPELRITSKKDSWLERFEKGHAQFEFLSLHTKIASIESYLDFHLSNKSCHYPDSELVAKLMKTLAEKAPLKESSLFTKYNELLEKFNRFQTAFPPIKFSEPLPDLTAEELSEKAANGKKPSYYTVFKDYVDVQKI